MKNMNIPVNKAKMIATFGPAISTRKILLEIVTAGVDVIRFNFSHGSYEEHKKGFDLVKSINKEYGLNIAILADMQGPKIRLGEVEGSLVLEPNSTVQITDIPAVSTKDRLYISYRGLFKEVKPLDRILINDGRVELSVLNSDKNGIKARVVHGGELTSKKGVNLPDSDLKTPALTDKDKEDLQFALKEEANWIALSFVRKAEDVNEMA